MENNFFKKLEEEALWHKEDTLFDADRIKSYARGYILNKIQEKKEKERGFFFEEIVCDFFEYLGYRVTRTKKTRDRGLDGIVDVKIMPLGEVKLGIQAKWGRIDSGDVDGFIQSLENAEIRLGVIACRDSTRLQKYTLPAKIKSILFFRNIKAKVKDIPDVGIEPVFILKLDDMIEVTSKKIRDIVSSTYKR